MMIIIIIDNICRPVPEQAGGGAGGVHEVPEPGAAAALPQHHQDHPRQHRHPTLPHVPGHQVYQHLV